MLEMLGYSMLQDPGRDVPEVACRDGEDGVADERVRLGERDDLVAAGVCGISRPSVSGSAA